MDIGIDVIEIQRIRKALKRTNKQFVRRVYTEREIESFPEKTALYYALNFSFKESVWKAMPDEIQVETYFRDIEIIWKDRRPELFLFSKKAETAFLDFTVTGRCAFTASLLF